MRRLQADAVSEGRTNRAVSRGANSLRAVERHWKNGKQGAGKLRFFTHKRIYPEIIHGLGMGPQKCSPS